MRTITAIVLHCTATPQNTNIESIQRYWKEVMKWQLPGYHYIIKPDGAVVNLQPIAKTTNGVAGHNAHSIHISYIGGVDKGGKGLDNRTPQQKLAQINLLKRLRILFPHANILGHRDFPGVHKECPSFDVKTWLKTVNLKS